MKERPTIVFRRTLNRDLTPRKAKFDDKGKQTRVENPGEFVEDWEKALVSPRHPFDPYVWVTTDWVNAQISKGRIPIAIKHFDKLPAGYPAEWRAKLNIIAATLSPMIANSDGVISLNAENEALKKRLEELEAGNGEAKLREQGKSDRRVAGKAKGPSGATGETTDIA